MFGFLGLPPRPPAYRAVVLAAVVAGSPRQARSRRVRRSAMITGRGCAWYDARPRGPAPRTCRAPSRACAGSREPSDAARARKIARPACSSVPAMAAAIWDIAGGEHDTGRKGGVDEGIEGLHGSPTRRVRASGRDRRCIHQVILAECAAARAASEGFPRACARSAWRATSSRRWPARSCIVPRTPAPGDHRRPPQPPRARLARRPATTAASTTAR